MKHQNNSMKKAFCILAIALTIVLPVKGQIFYTQEDLDTLRMEQWEDAGLIVPIHLQDFDQSELYLPLGEGFLMLAALGGAYLLGKKRREEE